MLQRRGLGGRVHGSFDDPNVDPDMTLSYRSDMAIRVELDKLEEENDEW